MLVLIDSNKTLRCARERDPDLTIGADGYPTKLIAIRSQQGKDHGTLQDKHNYLLLSLSVY
jgi:hypothetical protein